MVGPTPSLKGGEINKDPIGQKIVSTWVSLGASPFALALTRRLVSKTKGGSAGADPPFLYDEPPVGLGKDRNQYIPPMPPPGGIAGAAGFSSGISVTRASVVNKRPEMLAAFCNAVRVTLAGSMTPDSNMSVNLF